MPHSHSDHESADLWTYLGGCGDLTRLPAFAFWTGQMFDLATNFRRTKYGLSWYAVGVGCSLSAIITGSYAFLNFIFNANYQDKKDKKAELDENTPLLSTQKQSRSRDCLAYSTVPFSFIAHTIDIATPVVFVVLLALKLKKLSRWQEAIIHIGAATLAGLTAIADTRTDYKNLSIRLSTQNNMKKDSPQEHHSHSPDSYTIAGTIGESVSGLVGDTYWIALVVDLLIRATGQNINLTEVNVSWPALGVGLFFGIFSVIGATYCHFIQNKLHQVSPDEITETKNQVNEIKKANTDQNKIKLTNYQYAALFGDTISHIGETAGTLVFMIHLIFNDLQDWQIGIVYAGALLLGGLFSVANIRSCKNNLQINNSLNRG